VGTGEGSDDVGGDVDTGEESDDVGGDVDSGEGFTFFFLFIITGVEGLASVSLDEMNGKDSEDCIASFPKIKTLLFSNGTKNLGVFKLNPHW